MSACAAAASVSRAPCSAATRFVAEHRPTHTASCGPWAKPARLGARHSGWSRVQPLSCGGLRIRARARPQPPSALWQANRDKAAQLAAELRTHGTAGVLAYGLLNTAYYSTAFVFVWTCVLKVPPGLGTAAAARRFAEVFAVVWAGSQVTKLPRFGGALLLAPVASKLLGLVETRLPQSTRSRGVAFAVLVLGCLLVAAALFGAIILLWS